MQPETTETTGGTAPPVPRHPLPGRLRRALRLPVHEAPSEAHFDPQLLDIVQEPPPPLPGRVLRTVALLFLVILAWAALGRLDIVARADGKLVPQTRLKVVQPFEGGRVAKILVADGDQVRAGALLLLMDRQLSQADWRKLQAELNSDNLQLRRIEAELAGAPFERLESDATTDYTQVAEQYRAHRNAYRHALAEQRAALERAQRDREAAGEIEQKLKETLRIYRENEQVFATLGEKGYSSRLQMLEHQRERIEVEQDLRAQRYTIESLDATVRATRERLRSIESAYRQQLLDERHTLSRELAQLEEELRKQDYRNGLLELKAPQDGVVMDLATHTEGTVVPAGTVLLRLVPVDEPLKAEVYMGNSDVGFVHAGQTARIKLASYEFQKYGTINAEVERVSADAIDNADTGSDSGDEQRPPGSSLSYRTVLALETQHLARNGKRFDLRPGMHVTAEIKLGERSVLEYLFSPIQATVSEAGTER
jgi:HlyD family secretion protein